jgi:crotonobetainyl-CoA:carnitine CoA-transferase CaiB-like acyl-CoA transferase
VLRRAGITVQPAHAGEADQQVEPWPDAVPALSPAEVVGRLREVDICITDSFAVLEPALGGEEPWAKELSRLVLVELQPPAAENDANARIAAASGIGAVIGEADRPGLAPPGRMLEALVGLQAATAALAAWLGARRDGIGDHVRVDPVHCIAGMSGVNAIQFLNYDRRWRRSGRSASGSGGLFPLRMFPCRDGWVVVICRARAEWEAFVAMLGNPPWSREERFADPMFIATHHAEEAAALVTQALSTRSVEDLVAAARTHRVPLAPLRSVAEAMADPRLFVQPGRADPLPPVSAHRPHPRPPAWTARPPETARLGRPGPLAGLRVLDLGWIWAAPIAGAWLADLGADVVKVESFERLDGARRRGLEFPAGDQSPRSRLPGYERTWLFNATNRNKRSAVMELKVPEERERFLALVAEADVVLESFSEGVMERLGIAPEVLLDCNPALVLVSMGGRTVDGEYASRSYAPILSALAGIESTVVDRGGDPLGLLNWGVADPNAGAWAAFSVVAALATGQGGNHLLVSQLRALVNTCLSAYRGTDPPLAELPDPSEVTRAHLDGVAEGPLGDVYRSIVVRAWSPEVGERWAFGSPWQFRHMSVGVTAGAPLLGSTPVEALCAAWGAEVEPARQAPAEVDASQVSPT